MIDWERIHGLRDDIGPDGFAEVLCAFLEETDAAVARLTSVGAALERELHFLKGSALNLGLTELAAACVAAERDVARGQTPDLGELGSLYALSRAELQDGLADSRAA